MDALERTQHLLHAQLPAFQCKLKKTQQIIEEAMRTIERPYLSLSGGLDSQVVLDLLWRAGYRMPVLFGDDGFDFPENLTFLGFLVQAYQLDIQVVRCMAPWRAWCKEMDRADLCDDPPALEAWCNPHEWSATWDSLKDARQHGATGVFLGMLAKESRTRGYALQGGYKPLYQVKSEQGMWHCSPLAAWSKFDVWAYVVKKNLPYNPVYDKLATLGVPLEQRRVAPLTCFRVLHLGSGAMLRAGWPALWNQLVAIFPRISTYS